MSDLDQYTGNDPDSPFRDPVARETSYIAPATMRDFAQSIIDAITAASQQSGVIASMRYRYNANAPPPASGQLRFDNADQTLATSLYVSLTTDGGDDASNAFAVMDPAGVYVQDENDAARWQEYEITGQSIQPDYVQFTVAHTRGGGVIPANQTIAVAWLR